VEEDVLLQAIEENGGIQIKTEVDTGYDGDEYDNMSKYEYIREYYKFPDSSVICVKTMCWVNTYGYDDDCGIVALYAVQL
jgi:hypothetical protein